MLTMRFATEQVPLTVCPLSNVLIANAVPTLADHPYAAMRAAEGAFLLYPIGSLDDDPETIIEFYGLSPRPVAATGLKRQRALVTIEFFRLDDPED